MISDEQNQKNKAAALKLTTELNAALGIEWPENDPSHVNASALAKPENRSRLKALVAEFNRLKAEGIGATLFADIWKRWNSETWNGRK